ncbi:MAG TPA: LLM class flavin-dependent oxidoreductase [Solirubrobacterales bacterium]|nr:LLM class flavin-dependent oxidoreductase [Solirubrobacterales bacterium]
MAADLRLSVLDQTPVSEGSTAAQALRNSIDLARLADRLGYHRYWVAEHHGGELVAGPSPEVLIGPIAAATGRMRVGSGGVMLPHYSPLKVAESFGVLAGLYPGRIDLGIGRAAGTDPMTTHALQRDRSRAMPDDFPEQLAELLGYFERSFPADHPLARLAASLPGNPEAPEIWLLGSSEQSALWAGELGLRYAFADFINPRGVPYAEIYRERFTPGARLPEPQLAVAVRAIVAETEEEAERLSTSWRMAFDLLRRGRPVAVPPPEKAARYLELHGEEPQGLGGKPRRLTGTAAQVRAEIEEVAEAYGAEEAIVVTITHDHEARRRSYELLAAGFGLEAGPSAPAPTVPESAGRTS